MVDLGVVGSTVSGSDTVADCLDDGLELGEKMEPLASSEVFRHEEARLLTFKHWPRDWGAQLARYGFCSLREDSQGSVHCVFCGLEISDFSTPQEAQLKHWQFARQYCPFMLGNNVHNVPLHGQQVVCQKRPVTHVPVEHSHLLRATPATHIRTNDHKEHTHPGTVSSTARHPEMTSPSHLPADLGREPASSRTHKHGSDSPITAIHWTEIVRTARHPAMASYQARLDTLKRWPLLKPSPTELAKAGFYHVKCFSGSSFPGSESRLQGAGECRDSVKCFWCGERIHRWRKTDDAVIEHARLSPGCLYVIQLLGQQLHDDIVNVTASRKQRDDTLDVVPPSLRQSARSHPTEFHPASGMPETSQPTLTSSQLDDVMQSPSVQTVLQMGFPSQLIRDLLSHNSQRLTADTLCHLALQAAEQTSRLPPREQTSRLPPAEHTWSTCPAEHGSRVPPLASTGQDPRNDLSRVAEAGQTGEAFSPYQSRTFPHNVVPEAARASVPACVRPGERSEDRVMCKVCSEAEVKVIFRPCNHLVCCQQCTALFTSCPVCQQLIEGILTVYLT